MGKFASALPEPLTQWWNWLWIRYYFKFVLPKIEFAEVDGIRLDLRAFSSKVRNRLLRGYEQSERRMCQEFLKPTDSVLEIGGGIGFIGLFCQKKIGIRNYLTVEANPNTIEILKRNYSLNGLLPAVWNYAVAKTRGTVELHIGGDFWEHFIGTAQNETNSAVSVPSLPFDELLGKAGKEFNVLIIDIEGAERFIDFAKLPQSVTKIIIELHPHLIGQRAVTAFLTTLNNHGYQVRCEDGNTFALLKNE